MCSCFLKSTLSFTLLQNDFVIENVVGQAVHSRPRVSFTTIHMIIHYIGLESPILLSVFIAAFLPYAHHEYEYIYAYFVFPCRVAVFMFTQR